MKLKVIKADGSIEKYLHTKVLGSVSNAFSLVGEPNIFAAEQFAEVITFYLFRERNIGTVTTDEIHIMIQATLSATGYADAANALNEYHLNRKLERKRIEVVDDDDGADRTGQSCSSLAWDKSQIVHDLVTEDDFDMNIARAIASAVEEKVLSIGMTRIRRKLIKQLVLADTETMLQAQEQLQMITS